MPADDSRQDSGVNARPGLARDTASTDRLLSYYQSALAGKDTYGESYSEHGVTPTSVKNTVRLIHHKRENSTGSSCSSSSDYSADSPLASPTNTTPSTSSSTSRVRRRSSIPSEGGEDRRRGAVVEMNAHSGKTGTDKRPSPSDIRSRRGVNTRLEGLALVAPPDAAPRTYTQLTPPPTAPIVGPSVDRVLRSNDSIALHQRSASEAVGLRHKTSRDVGIVGTSKSIPPATNAPKLDGNQQGVTPGSLKPPIFQRPQTRSPSPGGTSDASDSSFRRNLSTPRRAPPMLAHHTTYPILTSEISQAKQIGAPVASPVIGKINNAYSTDTRLDTPFSAPDDPKPISSPLLPVSPTMSYLRYQPGLHATAGPLPPPPKAIGLESSSPPPPRPPRLHSPPITRRRGDIDAVRQALQLPPSVSAVLASKLPSSTNRSSSPSSSATKLNPSTQPTRNANSTTSDHRESASVLSTTAIQGSHISEKPNHVREGAFPPSASSSLASTNGSMDDARAKGSDDQAGNKSRSPPLRTQSSATMPQVPEEGPPVISLRTNATPLHGDGVSVKTSPPEPISNTEPSPDSSVSINVAPATPALDNEAYKDASSAMPPTPPAEDSGSDFGDTPSPPPKSLRNSWTANLKRFSSLPRTPSPQSKRSSAGSSLYRNRTTRTPSRSRSPSPLSTPLHHEDFLDTPHARPRPPPRIEYISPYPPAMYCGDVTCKKTALERCAGYAAKINELYVTDCGLAGWLQTSGIGLRSPKKQSNMLSASPSQSFTPQPRQTSGSSTFSEVTFPRRPDATLATDLSPRPSQDVPHTAPTLPYPSLMLQPPTRSSTMISAAPSSLRSMASPQSARTGFFASLGRRASLKKERPLPHTILTHSTNKLMKPGPASPHPRPVNLSNNPSVPGGPRAPPNRMTRASTMMVAPMTAQPSSSSETRPSSFERGAPMKRGSTMIHGPKSQHNHAPSSGDEVLDIRHDSTDFMKQVDKLSDLLPHADKAVLAGYLRRAGQDMLAIGQYLEDEKNGAIRRA
ncbi:hypothetical protein BDN71DRAFT_1447214 [Pleurotus eryngii]|uniref:Uncharacterized protein n=1 Tax=Pleurotus eryngii TaxID=5323 RepID=A0A9P6DFS9_PLEER|nr:hypothetical protein BDN71DRAFT_1447214 [Pleurotus eryngii]